MGLVVKLVVGVHYPAQVDAADLFSAALVLQIVEQPVNDATNSSLVFQIVNVFWKKSGEHNIGMDQAEMLHKSGILYK